MTHAANLLQLDYRAEARKLGHPVAPIIDIHSHISGDVAVDVYAEAAELYGIARTYSMTPRPLAESVARKLGDRIRFIAVPNFGSPDRFHAFTEGYLDDIRYFREVHGSRMIKFWNAPRLHDFVPTEHARDVIGFDSPWRIRQAELAQELGMMIMVHVADPDTWFKTTYADASRYGTKVEQYASLERALDRFDCPWIAAHMGGWPEDLAFLSGLLERHDNLYLDCSATKWQVRELSKHSHDDFMRFATRWNGRILFGSDIVTTEQHIEKTDGGSHPMGALASTREQAFDLYASRYWALRTMFETDYDGQSPIADPDLAKVEPERFTELDAPRLVGRSMPHDMLRTLYTASELVLTRAHDTASRT
ncbi:MAG: amidohydrolase family protein [Phycisphaeraceae bacterium]|nr:amidohydrolase family protein [Phycisphaerales bacterium]MCB9860773.1 amidohydrolase family protein [Phycisphaeraceae bacterium]